MHFSNFVGIFALLSSGFAIPSENFDLDIIISAFVPFHTSVLNGAHVDSDITSSHTLLGAATESDVLTPAVCANFCAEPTPFNFAGTAASFDCFCDFDIESTAVQLPGEECNSPCSGDTELTCGGINAISIYQNRNPNVGPPPANKAQLGEWTFAGCVIDTLSTDNIRTLPTFVNIFPVTIENCITICQRQEHMVAGLEAGSECWCGDDLMPNISVPVSECSEACQGDHTELCGAPNRLSVYVQVPSPALLFRPSTRHIVRG